MSDSEKYIEKLTEYEKSQITEDELEIAQELFNLEIKETANILDETYHSSP
jgi:hypothetical protein